MGTKVEFKEEYKYIMIEMGRTNFTLAKKTIGHKDQYMFVATCRSRCQAETVVNLLNGKEE